jgi:K+-transporting ATPase ATPase C chain
MSKNRFNLGTTIRIAVLSLMLCGLAFPLFVTGVAQVLMPYQANGEIIKFNGHYIGSNLIAQDFTSPMFFHPRNDSASGVDPDITLQDAYSQIPRIHAATGVPLAVLEQIVDENIEKTLYIIGEPYVNVLRLNLTLIHSYPSIFK